MKRFATALTLLLTFALVALPAAAQTETPVPTAPPAFVPCAEPTPDPAVTPDPAATPAPPTCAHLLVTLAPAIEGGLADWYVDGLLGGAQLASLDVMVTPSASHKIEARAITDPAAGDVYEWVMSYPSYAYLLPGAEKSATLVVRKKFLKGFLKLTCKIANAQPEEVASCLPEVDGVALAEVAAGQTATFNLTPGKHALVVKPGPVGAWIAAPYSKTLYVYAGYSALTTATLTLVHGAPAGAEPATVVYVVDGDTIDVTIAGVKSRVRYIGMNTPETYEVCGYTATSANRTLVYGKTVALARDVSETDSFGRLLRYVYVDGLFVNAELVKRGFARAADYPPDTAFSSVFHALELEAQAAGLGCWLTTVWATPTPPPVPTAPTGGGAPVCDCSGNVYNCADFSSHSQAQACFDYCVAQGVGDVHNLDADSDGSACEALP